VLNVFISVERFLRRVRKNASFNLVNNNRGRKMLLDVLPRNVEAIRLRFDDHVIEFPPFDLIGRHVFSKGHFSRDSTSTLIAELTTRNLVSKQRPVMFEIGANIGTQTIYFAKSGLFSKIIAIEPDPANLEFLRRNIELNALQDVVTVVPCAVGEFEDELILTRVDGNSGNASFLHNAEGNAGSVKVPVLPFDKILEQVRVAPAEIGLIWMDIEGYEPVAMRSMSALFAVRTPIYTEFTPEMYGSKGASDFAEWLSGYYPDCKVWADGGSNECKTLELKNIHNQCDVLLLP
jgi:FkbM family methyltransferase